MSKANFKLRRVLSDLYSVYEIYDVVKTYSLENNDDVILLMDQVRSICPVVKSLIEEDSHVI